MKKIIISLLIISSSIIVFAQILLEIVGITIPRDMQGDRLVSSLNGENEKWNRDAVYYHYYEYPGIHMAKRH